MLYYLTRPLARIALKVFFKKIHFAHAERIPRNKAIILAANHPAAFMEPCLLAVLLPQTLHFLVKGDLFANPINRALLESWHMWPIYGRSDGHEKIRKNQLTMERCYEAFANKQTILIMAEGHTRHEKRLRPMMKGPARMAFGTVKAKKDVDVYIVPVGVNYTYADRFRGEVMFDIGEPIRILDYLYDYQQQPAKAIRKVTDKLGESLKAQVIHINEEADEQLIENLLVLRRNDVVEPVFPILLPHKKLLQREKRIVDTVNAMPKAQKCSLKGKVENYFSDLEAAGLSDFALLHPGYYNWQFTFTLVVGFIPFILGHILNYPPARLSKYLADTISKRREFYSSVLVSVGLGLFVLYYLGWIIAALVLSSWSFWLLVVMIPIWGYFSLIYKEFYEKWQAGKAFSKLSNEEVSNLREKRQAFDFIC